MLWELCIIEEEEVSSSPFSLLTYFAFSAMRLEIENETNRRTDEGTKEGEGRNGWDSGTFASFPLPFPNSHTGKILNLECRWIACPIRFLQIFLASFRLRRRRWSDRDRASNGDVVVVAAS